MLNEIFPSVLNIDYNAKRKHKSDDYLVCYINECVYLDEKKSLPLIKDFIDLKGNEKELKYLFTIDEKAYYWVDGFPLTDKDKYETFHIEYFRLHNLKCLSFAMIVAIQICRSSLNNKFCSKCGGELVPSETERAFICKDCKMIVYPKISPAVIVGIIDREKDKILLTKYTDSIYKRYALVAGYCEIGETLEETSKREVKEEVGLDIKNIRYYKSQPWGFSDSLLAGFFADVDGSTEFVLEEAELSEAIWLSRNEIPDYGEIKSLTQDMIEAFKQGKI